MSDETRRAEEDLAFLRGLVQGGGDVQRTTGKVFVASGVIYGLQVVGHGLQGLGVLKLDGLGALALALGPTVVFLAFLTWMLTRKREPRQNSTAKAFDAAFGAVGLTNGVLIAIFAPAAILKGDLNTWLFYPAVVYALQGTGWLIAWTLRKRAWMGLTALGWFGTAIAMGALIGTPYYPMVAAAGLLVLMIGPGLALMRRPA